MAVERNHWGPGGEVRNLPATTEPSQLSEAVDEAVSQQIAPAENSLPLQAFENESLWDQWEKTAGANLHHSRVTQTTSWMLHGLPADEQQMTAAGDSK